VPPLRPSLPAAVRAHPSSGRRWSSPRPRPPPELVLPQAAAGARPASSLPTPPDLSKPRARPPRPRAARARRHRTRARLPCPRTAMSSPDPPLPKLARLAGARPAPGSTCPGSEVTTSASGRRCCPWTGWRLGMMLTFSNMIFYFYGLTSGQLSMSAHI
jgi:hypothetical protein